MFQLRGALGEVDCQANPSDPVCSAFYGTPTIMQDWATKFLNNNAPAVLYTPQGAANAGANVVLQPPASPIAASAAGLFAKLSALPWWVKLGAVVGGGYLVYTHWLKKG